MSILISLHISYWSLKISDKKSLQIAIYPALFIEWSCKNNELNFIFITTPIIATDQMTDIRDTYPDIPRLVHSRYCYGRVFILRKSI